MTLNAGRTLGYVGTAVGAAVSIAANVYHTFIPAQPDRLSNAGWRQLGLQTKTIEPFTVGFAAFWPIAALLAVETIARVQWPLGRVWTVARFGAVGAVAIVAVVISYGHLYGLLRWNGESSLGYTIGPAAIDGLMLVSTLAVVATARSADSTQAAHESVDPTQSTRSAQSTSVESDPTPESGRVESGQPGGAVGSPESGRVESGRVESGRVGSTEPPTVGTRLHSVGRSESTESSSQVDRVAPYVKRVKEAAESGAIDYPIVKEQIQRQLKIGRGYTDAAVRQIQEEGWSPTWHQSQGSRAKAE